MQLISLTGLADVPISLALPNSHALVVRTGGEFKLPVIVTHDGDTAVEWPAASPLNLAYRWIDADDEVVDRDGRRSAIPGFSLAPGASVEVQLVGSAPAVDGRYKLVVSLVLENVHWACDVGPTGWTEVMVALAGEQAWPMKFRSSPGARALRGAIAASELARELRGHDLSQVRKDAPVEEVMPTLLLVQPMAHEPKIGRTARWLRRILGVTRLEQYLDDVSAVMNSQQQIVHDLATNVLSISNKIDSEAERSNQRERHVDEGLTDIRLDLKSRWRSFGEETQTQFENAEQRAQRLLDEIAKVRADVARGTTR